MGKKQDMETTELRETSVWEMEMETEGMKKSQCFHYVEIVSSFSILLLTFLSIISKCQKTQWVKYLKPT